jgi:hypothetical protein
LVEEFDGGFESGGVQGWFIKKGAPVFWPDIPPGVERQIEISWREPPAPGNQVAAGSASISGWMVSAASAMALSFAAEFHAAR